MCVEAVRPMGLEFIRYHRRKNLLGILPKFMESSKLAIWFYYNGDGHEHAVAVPHSPESQAGLAVFLPWLEGTK